MLEVERCEIIIPGQPVRWERAGSNQKRRYTKANVIAHSEVVQRAWMVAGRPRLPDNTPLGISATFYRDRKPHATPDIDNYLKLVLDALNGLAYRDDSQVTDLERIRKRRVPDGSEPHSVVELFVVSGVL